MLEINWTKRNRKERPSVARRPANIQTNRPAPPTKKKRKHASIVLVSAGRPRKSLISIFRLRQSSARLIETFWAHYSGRRVGENSSWSISLIRGGGAPGCLWQNIVNCLESCPWRKRSRLVCVFERVYILAYMLMGSLLIVFPPNARGAPCLHHRWDHLYTARPRHFLVTCILLGLCAYHISRAEIRQAKQSKMRISFSGAALSHWIYTYIVYIVHSLQH